ncbi:MAG TPA: long-chain fatty acid--CoA ligase [Burkholderiaceae bacterium]|nr:long-chain fatty acid--CoA ligase [Burkholderiaceae bacterium]
MHETVVHMLAAAAREAPAREALVLGDTRLDYRPYLSCVAGFAHELKRAVGTSDSRIAILLPNSIEICIATFAVIAAGAQVVPLNPLYTPRELEQILRDAEPAAIVYDAARAAEVEPLLDALAIPHRVRLTPGDGALTRWASMQVPLPEPLPRGDSLAFVQYTGGTTGRSKGVMLSNASVSVNVSQRESVLPTGRHGERVLCAMPLFHSYALAMGLFLCAYCAGTLVVMPRYRPDELLRLIVRERITIFPGSPTIYNGLLSFPEFERTDFSTLHTCYSGSAALPEQTLRRWEQATGAPIFEGYGQTEAGPVATFQPLHGRRVAGSAGIALAQTRIEIVDVHDGATVLPPGTSGEIRVRGPQVMQGYRNLPAETAEALRDGWLYTGDIGELDADGYLYIRDRKKDMAIVGGYNVYPREIDEVLAMHPAVHEAAAVGVPDAYRGEIIEAFVVLRAGVPASAQDLIEHCAHNLAKYKVPAAIRIVDELPKTTVGKIDRKALKAIAR